MSEGKAIGVVPIILAIVLPLLLGFAIYALMALNIPKDNQTMLLVVITALVGINQTLVNFFFGSSSSSRAKDAALAASIPSQPPGGDRPLQPLETKP